MVAKKSIRKNQSTIWQQVGGTIVPYVIDSMVVEKDIILTFLHCRNPCSPPIHLHETKVQSRCYGTTNHTLESNFCKSITDHALKILR